MKTPRKAPERSAGGEWFTIEEAAEQIGLSVAGLYGWLKRLHMKTVKAPGHRRHYLTQEQLNDIKQAKRSPVYAKAHT